MLTESGITMFRDRISLLALLYKDARHSRASTDGRWCVRYERCLPEEGGIKTVIPT